VQLPSYYLPRPEVDLTPETIAAFERLYAEAVEPGTGMEIDYRLSAPKWQFICYVCDNKSVLVHGSGNPNIEEFEPRQSNDTEEFGNRKAVYASSDGLWAMYFAIVDRDRYVKSLVNACFRVIEKDGSKSVHYYFFSINDDALPNGPWRTGTIYILPRDGFEQQAMVDYQDADIEIAQWASLSEVKPLAKITVEPHDFPFLSQIRGHNLDVLRQRTIRNPGGFPWLEDSPEL